jgi:uncharacterized protein YbjQ (UPF0145 family)
MKIILSILLFLPVLSLLGCSYGYTVRSEATLIGSTYTPSASIDVFFGEYRGSQNLEQIAFIRALGAQYSRTPELLNKLKMKAKSLGADAIIEIKTSDTKRGSGLLALDLITIGSTGKKDDNDTYNAPVLSGIAVKYVE